MRLHISHNTSYRYDTPAATVTQILRLTPRNHDGQHVVRWRVELSEDCILHEHEDAYGNLTHTFTADGPLQELVITVTGEVDTQDTHGIVRNAVERFPPQFFLRETDLTRPDAAIRDLAAELRAAGDPAALPLLHRLLARLHRDIIFDVAPTSPTTTASEAFALKRGVCQDIAHVFLSASRVLGIPARYIGGHLARSDDAVQRKRGTPGSKRTCRTSAGCRSIRPTAYPRPTPMCASRSASIISAHRRCGDPGSAAPVKR